MKPDQDLFPVTSATADMAARSCIVLAGCLSVNFCVTVLRPRGIEHALKHVPRTVISWGRSAFFFLSRVLATSSRKQRRRCAGTPRRLGHVTAIPRKFLEALLRYLDSAELPAAIGYLSPLRTCRRLHTLCALLMRAPWTFGSVFFACLKRVIDGSLSWSRDILATGVAGQRCAGSRGACYNKALTCLCQGGGHRRAGPVRLQAYYGVPVHHILRIPIVF